MHIISCEKKSRINTGEAPLRSILGPAGVSWEFLIYEEAGGFLSRIRYIRELRKRTGQAIRRARPSLIHCRSYLAALTGLHFKRTQDIPFVFDMRGLWADERMDGGIWQRSHPLHLLMYRYFKNRERAFVEEAGAIISLTEKGKAELQKLYPGCSPGSRTTVIPCCTDTQLFDPAKSGTVPVPGLRPDAHLLVYSGSVGTWYCTSEMIDCVLNWHSKMPQLQLLVLTRDQEAFAEVTRTKQIPEGLVILSSCSRDEMPAWLSMARAAIFFIKPAYSKLASSPTKMAECWSMGLPVITNAGIGDNDLLFSKYQGGVLTDGFTKNSYDEAFRAYRALKNEPAHYRRIAQQAFDLRMAVDRYLSVYQQLSGC